jgi:hypothetical protein
MRKLSFFLCCWLLPAGAVAQVQFPLGAANRDGTATISVIAREAIYPTYNDKVFYCDPVSNAPSFLFPDYGQANTSIGGCTIGRKYMYWTVEYKIDNLNNVRTFTVNPNPGEATKTVIVVSHNTRRTQCVGGGENHEYTNVRAFTIKFETPEFIGLDEVKNVCNSVDKEFNLVDNFTVKEGVTFYLDNTASAPITKLNPKDLTPGFHRLIAQKWYDNGVPDPTYGSHPGTVTTQWEFQVLQGTEITIGPYPATICQNAPGPVNVKASPQGGAWEGRGIDAAGNITPASAAIGRNLFTYKITNVAGCTSTKTIEVTINTPPELTVEDLPICRSAAPFPLTIGQPAGGTYTGRGVMNGTNYDPAQALVGSNLIRYHYTDPATNCSSVAEFYINVLDADNFKVGDDFTTCNTSEEVDLNRRTGVSPADGAIVWSGTGIVNSKYFSPSTAGVGLHTITGTLFIPETGCTYQKSFVAKVVVGPTIKAGDDITVCQNEPAFNIPGGSPIGGIWSGSNVSNNSFNPGAALPGDYMVTYTLTTAVCAVSANKIIAVKATPVLDVGPNFSVCRNAGPVQLPAAAPAGGRWLPDGNYYDPATGTVDPLKMAVGQNTLTYSYTDAVCTVTKQLVITVTLPPLAEAGPDLRSCLNGDPVPLPGDPAGWSGPGVDNGRFLPGRAGLGEHMLTYRVVDPITRCESSDNMYIRVAAPPIVKAGPDVVICKAGGDYYIPAGDPLGAVWSGPFVQNSFFQASAAPLGSYTVTLSFTDPATGCTGTDTKVIQLIAAPILDVGPDFSICRNAGPVQLPAAAPAGGRWLPDGNYYDPATGTVDPLKMAVGQNTLTYSYADAVCTVTKQLIITVTLPPLVDAGGDLRSCLNGDPVPLPGDPAGWSGPGVDNGRFLPRRAGLGEHMLTYSVVDPITRCGNSDNMYMRVAAPPIVKAGPDVVICKAGGDYYIPAGDPLGAVWSGPFIQNGYFQASAAPLGSYIVTLSFTDPATGCTGTDTKVIQLAAAPLLQVGADITTCAGSSKFAPPLPTVPGGKWAAFAGDFYDPINNMIDPAKMQLGQNYLIYTIVAASGCTIADTLGITKHPQPIVTGMRDFTSCISGAVIPLVANPQPGIWEGPAVDNNQGSFFVPAEAGKGEHIITYTFTDPATGCKTVDTTIAKVNPLPIISMPADSSICIASGSFALKALPNGGLWAGSAGITGATFNPALAGAGLHLISYTVVDPITRCSNTGNVSYTVKGLPGNIIITGDTAACEGTSLTLIAAADNTTSFEWYKINETTPFATGTTIRYTVKNDEQLLIKPKPVNTGECGGNGRVISIINNSPRGSVHYEGASDTLAFGGLYRATSQLEKAESYRWDFGDGGYSNQPAGNHYYYTPGAHLVQLQVTGATGCISKFALPRIFVRDETGKVPDPDFGRGDGQDPGGDGLLIYPTTFKERLTVEFQAKSEQEVVISFFDVTGGRQIYETKHTAVRGGNRIRLSTEKLPGAGVWYVIRVSCKDFQKTQVIRKL